ncbi:MAG TPA: hypothetical protein VJ672_06740 [Gemmatimonadaceae bacterium]|nr:hypothetical protein [Gemmatimonadaceae bacterium]
MRGIQVLLPAVLLASAACQPRQKVQLQELPEYPREAKTVSVLGDWVLATRPESTVFVGARQVELHIGMREFTIQARYPTRSDVVITGDVSTDGTAGPIQLIPRSIAGGAGGSAPPIAIATGQPISLIASAAGQTLVFGSLDPGAPPNPSSVWHRREAARAAGTYEAAGKIEPEKKP